MLNVVAPYFSLFLITFMEKNDLIHLDLPGGHHNTKHDGTKLNDTQQNKILLNDKQHENICKLHTFIVLILGHGACTKKPYGFVNYEKWTNFVVSWCLFIGCHKTHQLTGHKVVKFFLLISIISYLYITSKIL